MLSAQVDHLVEAKIEGLSDDQRRALKAAAPTLKDSAQRLSVMRCPTRSSTAISTPVTWRCGIRRTDLDWTDACVARPFVDLMTFFYSFGPASEDEAVRRRWLDRYLSRWSDVVGRSVHWRSLTGSSRWRRCTT